MDNELQHHGIKGMKWGVRRFRNKDGTLTAAGKKRRRDSWSDDAKTAHDIRSTKTVKQMSNADLRKLNERASLENQYSQLNAANIVRGMAYVTTALTVLNTVANAPATFTKLAGIGNSIVNKVISGSA